MLILQKCLVMVKVIDKLSKWSISISIRKIVNLNTVLGVANKMFPSDIAFSV